MGEAAERLGQAVDRLVRQVGHWQAGRWSANASGAVTANASGAANANASVAGMSGGGGRSDRVYALVQVLADTAAKVVGEAPRAVPRLADSVLPDQLRVMADDLVAVGAGEEIVARAAEDVDAVRRAL